MKTINKIIMVVSIFATSIAVHPWIGWVGSLIACLAALFAIMDELRPARRWNTEELLAEKKRIESKQSDSVTKKSTYAIVEWMLQRYAVQGMTQGEYRRTLAKHKRKADKIIDNPSLIKPFVPYKSPDVRKTIVTRKEFSKFVIPHVRLLGYWPDGLGDDIDKDVEEFLWNTIQNLQGWKAQQSLFDTWGYLNIDCFYIIKAIEQAMSSYRWFKTAKNNGYDTVHVMTDRHHCGRKTPDDINVKDMEAAYSSQNKNILIVPFPSCPLNARDGGGLCSCAITLGFITRDGDDPEFTKWWRQEIKKMRR